MKWLGKVAIIFVLPLLLFCWHHAYYGERHLSGNLLEAARTGDYLEVVGYLNEGADVNTRDQDGLTPLIWAAIQGHEEVVRVLLEQGAALEAKNNNGDTALMWASVMGHKEVVELLLGHGANADLSEPKSGVTALMAAAAEGHTDVVEVLLEKGAAVNVSDRNGNTALTQASIRGYGEVVDLLLASGATFNGIRPTAVATAFIFVSPDGRPAGMDLVRFGQNPCVLRSQSVPVTDALIRDVPRAEARCHLASASSAKLGAIPAVFNTTNKIGVFSAQ
ncbi:MAG: ankyrin repeat domain-containing protein [Desulfomonilaceae bacterium]